MNDEYIKNLIDEIKFEDNFLNNFNGLLLTNKEVQILRLYNINFENCRNLNELLCIIDDILNEESFDDLEEISNDIAERNYYQNTNK